MNTAHQQIPEHMINEGHLINDAIDQGLITKAEASRGLPKGTEAIAKLMRRMVKVSYFVELPPETVEPSERGRKLQELINQPIDDPELGTLPLVDYLKHHNQSLSIAMSSLDSDTAEAIRILNEKEVPVTGWVVLSDDLGYWTNKTNVRQTIEQIKNVLAFADEQGIKLDGIGFDLEKPIDYIASLSQLTTGKFTIKSLAKVRPLSKAWLNYRKGRRSASDNPQRQLQDYLDELRASGIKVQKYEMPRPLKRLLGDLKVTNTDETIEMTYTSTMPGFAQKSGRAMKLFHTPEHVPALGLVTGIEGETPGRDLTNGILPPHLNKQGMVRDIRAGLTIDISRRVAGRRLAVFALNDASVATMTNDALREAFTPRV